MGFWIFMLVMTLLIPLTMIAFGTIFKEAAKKHKCLLWVQNIDVYEKYGHLDVCPSTCRTYLAFDRDSDNHTFRYRNGTCIPQGD